MAASGGRISKGVQEFYETWLGNMRSGGVPDSDLIPFSDLDPDQMSDWTLAYASTIELAARMGRAVSGVKIYGD